MSDEGTTGFPPPPEQTPAPTPEPVRPPAAPSKPFGQQVREFLASAQAEPTGLFAAGIVLVVCAIASLIGWVPLSWPSRFINDLLPDYYTWCGGNFRFFPGSPQMYVCSLAVGALAAAGSLVIVVVLFILRRPIAAAFAAIARRLPEEARFLVGPIAGTLAFTVAWAGTHYTDEAVGSIGLVPHPVFPAVVGLFLYAVARWGGAMQRALGPLLGLRDRYPIGYRVLAAILIPLLFSLLLGNASNPEAARKGQIVAIVALLCGYIALMPRTGPPLSGIERTLREMGAP